ncbi:disease resistance protein [Spatholobus suberectus]|nr:disease resistance protein [Spatholobus suberectus]
MGRPKGDKYYWNQVTIEENGKWKCKHCNLTFSGGFSRIKAHVDQTKGKGITVCSVNHGNDINRDPGPFNSSAPQEAVNTLNTLQGSLAEHLVNGGSNVNGAFQSELNELVSDLTREEEDIKGQLQWWEFRGKKRKSRVDTWLNEVQDLKKRAVDMNDSLDQLFGSANFDEPQWTEEVRKHRSLKEIVDEGHIIVDKLINHSLLLENEYDGIEMHGLVRNMVCHILNESHSYIYMVKYNGKLRKIPHMREWTIDLEAVSLAGNRIEEIPEGTSPNCPHLSTLILSDNCISHIPECFFTHMNALTLLDLSDNDRLTSLPHSLSNLRSLLLKLYSCCMKSFLFELKKVLKNIRGKKGGKEKKKNKQIKNLLSRQGTSNAMLKLFSCPECATESCKSS